MTTFSRTPGRSRFRSASALRGDQYTKKRQIGAISSTGVSFFLCATTIYRLDDDDKKKGLILGEAQKPCCGAYLISFSFLLG